MKRTIKKVISLVLSLVLMILCFSACADDNVRLYEDPSSGNYDNNNSVSTVKKSINLGYSGSSSLNPYFITANLNYNLISLMYQSLYKLDSSYIPYEQLAMSCNYDGKNTVTVKIDASVKFSDGTNLSASDIVYSFNKAVSSSLYSSALKNIKNLASAGNDTVRITLASTDVFFKNILTFPIVKSGTGENEKSVPLGSGMYKLNGETLIYNPYYKGNSPFIGTINLKKISESSTFALALESGNVDGIFDDLSSGSYTRVAANTKNVNLNNLVFLGINSSVAVLKLNKIRQAIYYSVNRNDIVTNDFADFASAAFTPFNPKWSEYYSLNYDEASLSLNYTMASQMLKEAGYSQCNLTLIVNKDNNFKCDTADSIAENLKNSNFNITVKKLSETEFANALSQGKYDLYIGEMKFADNMDLISLFSVYGTSQASASGVAYKQYSEGTIVMNDFIGIFLNDIPFVPICYRLGVFTYSRSISSEIDATYTDLFKNISLWTVNS